MKKSFIAVLLLCLSSAASAATLTITPITWDVVGLDSNNPAVGPNQYLVGVRVSNTGGGTATNVTANFIWDSANANINIAAGSASTLSVASLAVGTSTDFYFNVDITRTAAAYDTARKYHITVTSDSGTTISTPTPRQVYVEHIISQNRNGVDIMTGPGGAAPATTVFVGGTYVYEVNYHTATGGYDQLEAFAFFPNTLFQVLSVTTTYAVPTGATNDKVYADAGGFDDDPTSPSYRTIIGPENYVGGKAGGNAIKSIYTIKVVGTGSATVANTINDHSGGSFHYNADFGTGIGTKTLTITALQAQADLSLTKSVDIPNQSLGNNVTFTLTLANTVAGNADATGVKVTDLLPAGLQFVSASPSAGQTYTPSTGIWNVGSLAFGNTTTLTITAKVVQTGISVNNASITAADQSDPSAANNSASASVGPPVPNGALSLVATSEAHTTGANLAIGEIARYRVAYVLAEGSSTNAQFVHTLPANMSYVGNPKVAFVSSVPAAATNSADYCSTANLAGWSGGKFQGASVPNTGAGTNKGAALNVGERVLVKNQTSAFQNGIYVVINNSNGASAEWDRVTDYDSDAEINNGDIIAVLSGTSLAGTKWQLQTTDPTVINTTTLNFSAAGVASSSLSGSGLIVTGDETTVDSITPTFALPAGNVTNVGQVYTFSFGNLTNPDSDANKEFVILEFNAQVTNVAANTAGTSQLNKCAVSINGSTSTPGLPDTTTTLQHTAIVVEPSISGTKTANTVNVARSGVVSYTLNYVASSAANTSNAYDVVITDTLPSAAPNTLTLDTTSIVITLGGGASGASIASSSATGFTINVSTVPPGSTIQVTYNATTGATASNGANLSNSMVFTYTGLPGTQGTTSNTTGSSLAVGSAGTSTGERIGSGVSPNTYRITGTATVTVAASADLKVVNTVSNALPNVGQNVTFHIVLTNNGPDLATTAIQPITLSNVLPAGLTFVSATASAGIASTVGNTTTWTLASALASGASVTLDVVGTVVSTNTQIDVAQVTHSDLFDPVSNNNIGRASETPVEADLAVTNTVDNANPNFGQNVTFTITLTNQGPNNATGVAVTNVLPAGLTFVSSTTSAGTSFNSGTGVWTVGAINVSTTSSPNVATLTVTATVNSTAVQTDTASVSATNQYDSNSANNSASASITPHAADLSITNAVDNASPNLGQNVTFTIVLSNGGPDNATNVNVKDLLPAGLTYSSSTVTQGNYTRGTGVWAVGAVNNGASATLTITATVSSLGATITTAQVTAADQVDPDSTPNNNVAGEDDQDSVTVTPHAADLSLTNIVDVPAPNVGQNVTFTVTVSNSGPDNATNVSAKDLLPAGLTFSSATPSQGTYTSGTGVWSVGTINNGANATLAIVATVSSSGIKTTTAQVTAADQADPDSTPNNNAAGEDDQASVSITPQAADLSLTNTVDNATPNVGQTVTFTVTVSNAGPDNATNVSAKDLLPAGLTFSSATPSQGTYTSGTGVWSVGTINNGANATLAIVATVSSLGIKTTTAQVTAADQADPDSTPNNNAAGEDDQASVSVTPQAADLSLTNVVNNATPNVGQTVSFTVTVSNGGPDAGTNVSVKDLLHDGLTFSSAAPSQGTYTSGTGVWSVGTINNGANATLAIVATVSSLGIKTTTAQVTAADQADPDSTPNNNAAGEDDQASVSVTPQAADLSLTNVVNNATPNVGQTVTFTVTVSNSGPDNATNVSAKDLLPAGLTFSSASPSQGTYTSGTGLWSVGTINNGANASLAIVATVSSSGIKTTTAQVTAADQADPDSTPNNNAAGEDDQASVSVTPQAADLSLTNTVDNATPNVGQNVTFTVTVSNSGPDNATNVSAKDLVPAGLTFSSATPSQGTYTNGTGVWSVGTINNGANATLAIVATVATSGAKTTTAQVTAADQADPDSTPNNNAVGEDDQASVSVTPQVADLSLTNTVDNATPIVGQNVTFTITLNNAGPDSATNVNVLDLLAAGLTYVSSTPSQGSYANGTGIWNVGSLNNGSNATLTLVATVNASGSITQTAQVSTADQFDPDSTPNNNNGSEDDQASVSLGGASADLSLTSTVDNPTPNVGDNVTFVLTLDNAGPSGATNVVVADLLPPGLSFVLGTPSQGTYVDSSGVWTVGSVAVGGSATLTITALVTSAGASTNTAQVSASDQTDPDSTPNNNNAAEDDQTSKLVTPQEADLGLSKTVDLAAPNMGDDVTFTISLTNSGPDAATNVTVNDALPAGLSIVSTTPSQGTFNAGVWTVGTVNNGATKTLTIVATVNATGAITNTVTIGTSNQFDPNGNNDSSSATVTAQQSDLGLSKTVDIAAPNIGDDVTFTISLTNFGPDAATNVTVNDALPAGLSIVSTTPSQGTFNAGVWTVGTVNNGATNTLTIVATVNATGAITNTATIGTSDQFDPNGNNDSSSATVAAQQADLSLTNTVDNASPAVGQNVTFTLILTNSGPNAATGVNVTDLLPAGLVFVSATAGQGTYANATGIWDVGTINNGASSTLQITATVNAAGAIDTTAQVTSSDTFDPDSTPNNNVAAEDDQASASVGGLQADLQITKTDGVASVVPGTSVTYTITVTNAGPSDVTGASVADTFPATLGGVTFTAVATGGATGFTANGSGNIADTVNLPNGSTITYTASATISASATGNLANTATITPPASVTDPTPGNNLATDTDSLTPQADLQITKTDGVASAVPGTSVTYTITVTNAGPSDVTGASVADTFPAALSGVTFTAVATGGATGFTANGSGNIADTVNLPDGSTITYTASATISAAATGNLANTATITPPAGVTDPTPGNNLATDTDSLTPQADLQITKTDGMAVALPGNSVTYTITVTNAGPSDANGAGVADTFPGILSGVSYSAVATGGASLFTVSGSGNISDTVNMPAGSTITYTATASISSFASGTLSNTASVSAPAGVTDPTPANNSATDTDTLTTLQSDLSLSVNVDNATPNVGQTVTFTVVLNNSGPDDATNVVVQDLLPAGLTYLSSTVMQGNYSNVSGNWNVGSVANGGSATLTITALVSNSGAKVNSAEVSASDQFDPDSTPSNNVAGEDDQSSAGVTPQLADLSVTISANNSAPSIGQNVLLTVALANAGPNTATNAAVSVVLPAGLSFVSANAASGTYNAGTGIWSAGSIVNNAITTLAITAAVTTTGASAIVAQVSASDQFDPDSTPDNNIPSEDDYASVILNASASVADLAISKIVDEPSPKFGQAVKFTIAVANAGPSDASGVTVSDLLPAGLTFISATASQGAYSAATGTWSAGAVPNGATVTLNIMATVDLASSITNVAQITAADQPDPNPANNIATATVAVAVADLSLTETVDNSNPLPGDTITYTLTLSNAGPSGATNVTILYPVPAGATFVSSTPMQGTYSSASGQWIVGSVPAGSSLTLTIVLTVNEGTTTLVTSGQVMTSDQFDPDSIPDNSSGSEDDESKGMLSLAASAPIGVQCFGAKYNFARANRDRLLLVAELGLPRNYKPAGKTLSLDLDGLTYNCTLDSRGNCRDGARLIQLRYNNNAWLLLLRSNGDNLKAMKSALNADVAAPQAMDVRIRINLDGKYFLGHTDPLYSAIRDRSGTLYRRK